MRLFPTKQERLNKRLIKACSSRQPDLSLVEQLVRDGADINNTTASKKGFSPFRIAFSYGQEDLALLLLSLGATPQLDVFIGELAGSYYCDANRRRSHSFALALVNHPVVVTTDNGRYAEAIYDTILHDQGKISNDLISALARKGTNINAYRGRDRFTALHAAVSNGLYEATKLLLDLGANTNARDKSGYLPRDYATRYPRIAELLEIHASKTPTSDASRPQAPVAQDDEIAGWELVTPDEIARVSEKKALHYKITEIFNFKARTYISLSQNLDTGAESQTLRFFDEFHDTTPIEDAYAALNKKGGNAQLPLGTVLLKKNLQ